MNLLIVLTSCGVSKETKEVSAKEESGTKIKEEKVESVKETDIVTPSNTKAEDITKDAEITPPSTSNVDDITYEEFMKMSDTDSYNFLAKLLPAHPELPSNLDLVYEGLTGEGTPNQNFVGHTVIEAIKILSGQSNVQTNTSTVDTSGIQINFKDMPYSDYINDNEPFNRIIYLDELSQANPQYNLDVDDLYDYLETKKGSNDTVINLIKQYIAEY